MEYCKHDREDAIEMVHFVNTVICNTMSAKFRGYYALHSVPKAIGGLLGDFWISNHASHLIFLFSLEKTPI